MALSSGNSGGAGLPASQFGKERSLQPAACKLEALVSATLLRAPWFLTSKSMDRPLEGLVCVHFTLQRKFEPPELQCCGV